MNLYCGKNVHFRRSSALESTRPMVPVLKYSLRFKIQVTFGHKRCYRIKVTFGEIALKLRQTNWNVARNNVNVVIDKLPNQMTVNTCLTIDI